MDNNISEVEIFNSDDNLLIEQVCEALKNADIEYLKTPKETINNNLKQIYTGGYCKGYKIIVLKENEKKAISAIEDIINSYTAEIYSEEIPEELKDSDEEYFEELVKKGKILSYKKDDGTEIKFVRKSEFIKKLKKEKNEILKDRKIIRHLYILIIPLIILEIVKYFYRNINGFSVQNIRYGIIMIGIIPAMIMSLSINKKITRMYKKFINNDKYEKSEKRINKIFMIFIMLVSIVCLTYSLDWVHTIVTGNRPIFSKKYTKEWISGQGYHSVFYNYYSYNNGRKLIAKRNEPIINSYEIVYEDGSKIEFNRIEIIKNKIYVAIPSFLKEMSKTANEGELNPYLLSIYGVKYETEEEYLSYVFSCVDINRNIENSKINDKINELINFYKKSYKDKITISKTYIEQIDNKNIGVVEYNVKTDNGRIDNHCEFIFEYNGKLIQCDFNTTCNQTLSNNYWGEYLIKTIEIYD